MNVVIGLYRSSDGKNSEANSELTQFILHRLESELFTGRQIKVDSVENKGNWQAPAILLNGELYSQGQIPDARDLITKVGEMLGDKELVEMAVHYANFRKGTAVSEDLAIPVVYYSPTCPHCRALKAYFEDMGVSYVARNIVDDSRSKEVMKELNPTMTIPVLTFKGEIVIGFAKDEIDRLVGIDATEYIPSGKKSEPGPEIKSEETEYIVDEARTLLLQNRDGDVTKASASLYPHQWSWDAAFIARGLLYYDPPSAYREIRSLFSGQWSDGFLPHMLFNPNHLHHFPGPEYWKAEYSGRTVEGKSTSGISQPPVHASMLSAAIELDPDKDRSRTELGWLYPRLKAMHDYYWKFRTDKDTGLVFLVHPWESGLDNAPLWDRALSAITSKSEWSRSMQEAYDELSSQGKRPARSYIAKYSYLVESLFSRKFDWEKIYREHEFKVLDVLFNSVLCKSEEDLGKIARYLGKDDSLHNERSVELKKAINQHLWDDGDGIYYDFDLVSREAIKKDTVFSYIPLYSKICSETQATRLIGHLKSHCFCIADKDCMGIPSYDMCKIDYEGEFYWRGPIWFNMSWYVYQGLLNYAYEEDARWLRNSLIKLVLDNGFYEYYKPETGEGLGAGGFSWTAALLIDLAARKGDD